MMRLFIVIGYYYYPYTVMRNAIDDLGSINTSRVYFIVVNAYSN